MCACSQSRDEPAKTWCGWTPSRCLSMNRNRDSFASSLYRFRERSICHGTCDFSFRGRPEGVVSPQP